jgi:hypothetical protein
MAQLVDARATRPFPYLQPQQKEGKGSATPDQGYLGRKFCIVGADIRGSHVLYHLGKNKEYNYSYKIVH